MQRSAATPTKIYGTQVENGPCICKETSYFFLGIFSPSRNKFSHLHWLSTYLCAWISNRSFPDLAGFREITLFSYIGNSTGRLQHYRITTKPKADCHHTLHSRSYLFCLQHYRTAKYAVQFKDVLHAEKGGMYENGIFVIIKISNPISWFKLVRTSPKVCPNSLCCTGTTPTHHDKRLTKSPPLGYVTGRLSSFKDLNRTVCLHVGSLSTLHHVYILRGALTRVTTTGEPIDHH